jgi:hypothetical protein
MAKEKGRRKTIRLRGCGRQTGTAAHSCGISTNIATTAPMVAETIDHITIMDDAKAVMAFLA